MNRNYNYLEVDHKPVQASPVATKERPHGQWIHLDLDGQIDRTINRLQVSDMFLPNFSVRISKGTFNQDALLYNTSAEGLDKLGSCMFLKGSVVSSYDSGTIESLEGTNNFKFDPQNEISHRIHAHKPYEFIHFSVDPNYFAGLLPANEAWAGSLQDRLLRKERLMGLQSPNITILQDRALQLVLNCPMTGELGVMMIETAIQQIILLQMHEIYCKEGEPVTLLSMRDRELIREVREYLSKHYLEDHSLSSLSMNFGVNTNKLMSLFKRLFGQSIFEYIAELRMTSAQRMLREEGLRVIDVARALGYKNAQHFSTAYKRKFGISPSVAKA